MADVKVAQAHGYNPTKFKSMAANDPKMSAGVAHKLLAAPHWQEGFARRWELGLVDHTIEARALEEPWRGLFSDDERAEAARRIDAISKH